MANFDQTVNYEVPIDEESTYELIVMVGHEQPGKIEVNPFLSSLTIPDDKLPSENSTRWNYELGKGSSIKDKALILSVLTRYEKEYPENEDQHKLLQVTIDLEETENDGNSNTRELPPKEDDSDRKIVDNKYDNVFFDIEIKFS